MCGGGGGGGGGGGLTDVKVEWVQVKGLFCPSLSVQQSLEGERERGREGEREGGRERDREACCVTGNAMMGHHFHKF